MEENDVQQASRLNSMNTMNTIRLLEAIQSAQQAFILGGATHQEVFDVLLDSLLKLTDSEFGFIGKVLTDEGGQPFLKTISLVNIAWNEETQRLYEQQSAEGMEFRHLNSLYGQVLKTHQPYISHNPAHDKHRFGTPSGHPALKSFLGVPVLFKDDLIGMYGIANSVLEYDVDLIKFLEPLTDTCAVLIEAIRVREENAKSTRSLETAQIGLNQQEQILQSLFLSESHYIIRTDLDGRYTYVNEGFRKHFGVADKVIGEHSLDSIHPDDHAACIATVEYCLSNPGKIKPVVLRKPLENALYLKTEWEFCALCDADGIPYEVQCVGRDITEQIRHNAQIEVLSHKIADLTLHLEQRVAERTKELRDVNREKDEFLSIAAHDLKNPLAAIKLSVERMIINIQRGKYDQITNVFQTITLATDRMLEIISNLLEINKLEAGHFPFAPTMCPAKIVEDITNEYQTRATEKGITLIYEQDDTAHIFADANALKHIADNLISNAIKYSPAWKTVYVKLHSVLQKDGEVIAIRLEVKDEGEGISKEDQKRLFGKFARLSARPTGGENSTGLGLSIVHRLVEIHQGKVWCVSEKGSGATFFVELPFPQRKK